MLGTGAIEVRRPSSSQGGSSLLEYGSDAGGQGKVFGGVTSHFTQTADDKSYWAAVGMKNKVGVTRYQNYELKHIKRSDGKFFWADSANREDINFTGAKDLTASVTWGWHHPSGVYNTIPVGSPLLDDQNNIYIGADDAIRKFDVNGVIKWSYAPRGQLAAAPSLCPAGARRLATSDVSFGGQEDMVRPDWAKGNETGTASELTPVQGASRPPT